MKKKTKIECNFVGSFKGTIKPSSTGAIFYPPKEHYDLGIKDDHLTFCHNFRRGRLDIHRRIIPYNTLPSQRVDFTWSFLYIMGYFLEQFAIMLPSSIKSLKQNPRNLKALVCTPTFVDFILNSLLESNIFDCQDNILSFEMNQKTLQTIRPTEQIDSETEFIKFIHPYDAIKKGYPSFFLLDQGEILHINLKNKLILIPPSLNQLNPDKNLLKEPFVDFFLQNFQFEPTISLKVLYPRLDPAEILRELTERVHNEMLPNPECSPLRLSYLDQYRLEDSLTSLTLFPYRRMGLTFAPINGLLLDGFLMKIYQSPNF